MSVGKLREGYKRTGLYRIYNLKDEMAQGRCVMLGSSVITNIIAWMTGSLFYTSFLMANGIDLVKIGIISFVPYIANCFSVFAPAILERFPQRRWVLFGGRLAYYTLNILAVTIVPMVIPDEGLKMTLFTIIIFAAHINNALDSGGYSAWHINFSPDSVRAEYISSSMIISNFIGLGMGLVSSFIADAFSASPYAYTIIVILRFAAYGLAIVELLILLSPVEYPYAHTGDKVRFTDVFTKPFSHKRFMLTQMILVLWTFFGNTDASAINYYLLNNVGTSYTFTSILNMFYPVFLLIFMTPAKRIIRRIGWMRSFAIGGILYAIPSAVYSLVTADNYLWLLTIVRFSQHMFGTLMNTAVTNMPFMNMPDSDRVSYFAFYTLDTNIAAFLGMLFGTWFVGAFPDLMLTIGGFQFCNIQVLMWVESFGRVFVPVLLLSLIQHIAPPDELHIAR